MTPQAADQLATRAVNQFRGGPTLNEWVHILQPLDEGTAGTALIRHTRAVAPTPTSYMHTYNALHTTADGPACGNCEQGAITAWTLHHDRWYRHSYACTCPASHPYRWLGNPPADAQRTDPHNHQETPT